jgi:Asp-tRNA(Asn)/Glu-tRNA(Gln) amidotransferase A subunit family amidase
MSTTELCYLTASEAIELIVAKKLSPVELMGAIIDRCEVVNPKVNALTVEFFDRALSQAREAENRYMRGGPCRSLEGIPIAIKDYHPVAGELTTYGSMVFADNRPAASAPCVDRLLNAGAIMHCRTTTPEFAVGFVTRSSLWGTTRNPWNLDYTSGGSSGGAAAAVAAGMTTLADGTDSGGSIRCPASMCGIFGFLPPYGRNPLDKGSIFERLLRYGPLTRSVADAALMQNAMSGFHSEDPATLREKMEIPPTITTDRKLKIALSIDLGFYPVDGEVEKAIRKGAATFVDLGHTVTEVKLPWTSAVTEAMNVYVEFLIHSAFAHLLRSHEKNLTPHVISLIRRGSVLTAQQLAAYFSTRRTMYEGLRPIIENYDLILCPTLAVPGVLAEHDNMAVDFEINGKPIGAYIDWGLTFPFNMIDYVPVATVPCDFSSDGIPIGMQIAGRPFDDLTVFQAAAAFESARPWLDKHPAL